MVKKKSLTMWGLWNFDVLKEVAYRRKDCRWAAEEMAPGGKTESDEMFRDGAFRITKIAVREL